MTGVTLNRTSATINKGATLQLTATVSPNNATNKAVTWKSSNTGIATVNGSGVVTGVTAGSAKITVTTADGGKTATCDVTVNSPIPTWLTELSSSSYARCYTYHPSYGYNVYSDMNLTTVRGEVWASDEVHLLGGAVNGNGTLVAYIDYPIGESYGNKGYIELWLVGGSWSGSSWKASSNQTIYKRSDLSDPIGTMETGDTVYTLQESDGKRQVMYSLTGGGWKIGWYQISGGQSGGGTATKRLQVPYFSQTDSNWSGVYVGTKTIGDIGCTITCLAMSESYRTGTTITPKDMRNRLSFSNNDIQWQSVYDLSSNPKYHFYGKDQYSASEVMQYAYTAINAGKPLIIEGTSSDDKTHWVVIVGYANLDPNNMQTSSFQINDPNSTSRTTLADFIRYKGTITSVMSY